MGTTFPNESADYRFARDRLLEAEIGLRRAMEAVSQARRQLPPGGKVLEDYVFDGLDTEGQPATIRFSELFAPDKDTLIVYNMMFPRHAGDDRAGANEGETAELPRDEQPCPSCTALLDQFDGAVAHLEAAGFNFAVIAKTTPERLAALARDRGWKNMRLVSAAQNGFNRDYHAENEDGQQVPMVSVFQRGPDGVRHFWSSEMILVPADPGQDPRAAGTLEPLWNLMDLTPGGRPDFYEQMQYDGKAAE
ncbi:DUF899 family protein [Mesorhizobium sp. LHD-90]|uniref:DUF899 family protein n=1 Tax=Mesorhizobium sp. LHD-90 TaxID=3071414 RepID=UPI0027DF1974|nr:DUF899 family protein [Mesorhizobium sp. LHD-90]MDQ6436419.1 DUF899 family protein [Mesorhizobium sp. LHD-90]